MLTNVLPRRTTWGRLVVLAVTVALAAAGLTARSPAARADQFCGPGYQASFRDGYLLCTPVPVDDLVQRVSSGRYAMTDAQYAGLRGLEDRAIANVTSVHGIPAGNEERLLWFARADLRAELFGLLLAAGQKSPDVRTADEVAALSWFADVQQRQNIATAEAARAEYAAFYGNTIGTGQAPANACTYHPPAPYQEESAEARDWQGCFGRVGPLDLGPHIPSFDDFTRWGTAAVQAPLTAGQALLESAAGQSALGLAAVGGVVGLGTSALVGLNLATAGLIGQAILPFAYASFTAVTFAAAVPASATSYVVAGGPAAALEAAAAGVPELTSSVIAGTGVSAGVVLGVAAIVLVALTIAVLTFIDVINNAQLLDRLDRGISEARSVHPDAAAVLATAQGTQSALAAVQAVTTTDSFAAGNGPASPSAAPGDPALRITNQYGGVVSGRTDRFSFTASGTQYYEEGTRQVRSGWFTDPGGVGKPVTTLAMPLWDPQPTVTNGVASPRYGFNYDAAVSTVMVNGQRRWLATALGRSGYPVAGSGCDDYDADGCWLTDKLPFLDPHSTYGPRFAELLPNAAPAFTIGQSPASVVQRQTLHVTALANGAPLLTDGDGDAVTVAWDVESCPPQALYLVIDGSPPPPCVPVQTGPATDFTFGPRGTYRIRATATDLFGARTVVTRDVVVGNAPPELSLTTGPPASLEEGGSIEVAGTLTDSYGDDPQAVIDWGDGSPPTAPGGLGFGGFRAFDVVHTYGRSSRGSPFTLRISATDGTATTVVTRSVSVTNVAPQLRPPAVASDQQSPADWTALDPGTDVTVRGLVVDPGSTSDLTVTATWYDGVVTTVHPQANGTATRPYSVTRTVTARTPAGSTELVRLVATDDAGAASAPTAFGGAVVNGLPAFEGLVTAPAAEGSASQVAGGLRDPNGDPTTLSVDWGDGSPQEVASRPGGAVPFGLQHTYARRGSYPVTLTGADGVGEPVVTQLTMAVPGTPPTLVAKRFAAAPVEGSPATLELGLSDVTGDAGRADVSWGDGGHAVVPYAAGTTALSVPHTYADDGPVDVTVQLSDGDGTAPAQTLLAVPVGNVAPVVDPLAVPTADEGSVLTLPVRFRDAGRLDPGTVTVDWGDGAVSRVPYPAGATAVDVGHVYADESPTGSYPVAVTVTDNGLASGGATGAAPVRGVAPVVTGLIVTGAAEGSLSTAVGSVADPGSRDSGTVLVDWGDGATSSVPYAAGGGFATTHRYADNGSYQVRVTPTDKDAVTGSPSAATSDVANVNPSAVVVALPAGVDEGSVVVGSVSFSDPGADAGVVEVDWGDGAPVQAVAYAAAQRTVAVPHTFADDDPSGTSSDRYPVRVTVRDKDGGSGTASGELIVRNVAPTVRAGLADLAGRPADATNPAVAGAPVRLVVVTEDPGSGDLFTGTVTWGDGSSSALPAARGAVVLTHVYAAAGTPVVSVTVADDDTGRGTAQVSVQVISPTASTQAVADRLADLAGQPGLPSKAAADLGKARKTLVGKDDDDGSGGAVEKLSRGKPQEALEAYEKAAKKLDEAVKDGAPVSAVQEIAVGIVLTARAVAQVEVDRAAAAAAARPPGKDRDRDLDRVADARLLLAKADAGLATGATTAATSACRDAVKAL